MAKKENNRPQYSEAGNQPLGTLKAEARGDLVIVDGGLQYEDLSPAEALIVAGIINQHQRTDWDFIEPILKDKYARL